MSDLPKFIKHFKASAAYHRRKAEQAEAEVARLEGLMRKGQQTLHPLSDAMETPKTELTTVDNQIYSSEATGAYPRRG